MVQPQMVPNPPQPQREPEKQSAPGARRWPSFRACTAATWRETARLWRKGWHYIRLPLPPELRHLHLWPRGEDEPKQKKTHEEMVKQCRRAGIILLGSLLIIAGIVMLVTPGPAVILIPAGFAVLAKEYPRARRVMRVLKTFYLASRRWWHGRCAVSEKAESADEKGDCQEPAPPPQSAPSSTATQP